MSETLQWIATAATIIAALVTAANLGARITGFGFCIYLVGSIAWLIAGSMTHQDAVVWNNVVLTVLNLFGIWRWLGRQAKVEKGAESAALSSHGEAGENLFANSLLSGGTVVRDGSTVGHAVDAMMGCGSGTIRYVVFSAGGVAGVGETLRRADWSQVSMRDGNFVLDVDPDRLPTVERDDWPGR